VSKIIILLPPSLELQDGSSKSLFKVGVSSSCTIVGVEKPISFYSNPIVPKLKKAKKVEWVLNKIYLGYRIVLGRGRDGS
jgi:hypothetical protein